MGQERAITTPDLPDRTPVKVALATTPLGIFGSAQAARRNVVELIPEIATQAPMISGSTGKRWHMIMAPEALKQVLRDKVEDYPKSIVTKLILGSAISNSLFVVEGAEWRWQRRAVAPVFSHRNITAMGPIMVGAAERAAARIGVAANTGGARAVDCFDEMVAATFEVIADVTLSGGEGFDRSSVHHAIEAYIAQTAKVSLLDVIGAPPWVPRPGRIFAAKPMKALQKLADDIITDRRTAGALAVPDLLDLLIAGEDPQTGRKMSEGEVRDNLLTFIVAGHETTALTLAWALYLMAFDPAVQEAAALEAAALKDRPAVVEDLAHLPLIRRIVDETLRLYPPAAFLARTAQVADRILGREIKPGDTVILPIYALHRHKKLWPEPDTFRPDRFADPKSIERFAYLPFGDGPRICIGAAFALQEAVLILATLLARYRFTAVPGRAPKPVMILTLRPQGGVWLTVERR
jgi:cytochrome P450